MVCTESTISSLGSTASTCPSSAGRSVSAARKRFAVHGADPVGAQPDLAGRLLAGHVQHRARLRGLRARLQQQGGLADAGLAGQQQDRPGHQAAAEHPVQLAEAGRAGHGRGRVHLRR